MTISRLFKTMAVACIAGLASAVLVAMPAAAATVTVEVRVGNYQDATKATLYEAPKTWVGTEDLKSLSKGRFDPVTKTVTFKNVPANRKVFVGFKTYDSPKAVVDFYHGKTSGYAYPLVTPATVGTSNLTLKTVTIPAPGKIQVKASAAINKDARLVLEKVNGEELWGIYPTTKGGVATFSGLVPGRYVVAYKGNANYLPKTVGTVTVKAGKTTTITNAPKKAAKITGKVTDSKGRALENVRVSITTKTDDYYEYLTDSKGKYTLGGLVAGTYVVTVNDMWAASSVTKYHSKAITVKGVKAGKTKSAGTTKLAVGATIRGSVKYAGSTARVSIVDSKGAVLVWTYLENKKTSYEVDGLPPGKYKVYVVEWASAKPKYGVASVEVKAGKTTKLKKITANKSLITLSGKVTGSGAAGATVFVEGTSWGNTTVSSSGTYKVTGLLPGKYTVLVKPNTGGHVTKSGTLSKSAKYNFKLPAAKSIKFTYAGKAIAGAEVYAYFADTDSKGVAKLAWSSFHKGKKPNMYASQILGNDTPFYFKLNKAKLNSKADLWALKVVGIGGR